jgi:hypothetical protein
VTGLVAVGLGIGAVATGIVYLDRHATFVDNNDPSVDRRAQEQLRSRAKTMGWIATGLTGAALVAGGVSVYLFVSPSSTDTREARLEPALGLDVRVVARGRF